MKTRFGTCFSVAFCLAFLVTACDQGAELDVSQDGPPALPGSMCFDEQAHEDCLLACERVADCGADATYLMGALADAGVLDANEKGESFWGSSSIWDTDADLACAAVCAVQVLVGDPAVDAAISCVLGPSMTCCDVKGCVGAPHDGTGEAPVDPDPEPTDPCEDVNCDDGLGCTDDTCTDGACTHVVMPSSCFVDGACRDEGDPNPANICQVCDSAAAQVAWTNAPDDSSCGFGPTAGTCQAGTCESFPVDPCEDVNCDDGLACTQDSCFEGTCSYPVLPTFCFVGGACQDAGAPNPADACKVCDPAVDQDTWSWAFNGTACGAGDGAGTCHSGVCVPTPPPETDPTCEETCAATCPPAEHVAGAVCWDTCLTECGIEVQATQCELFCDALAGCVDSDNPGTEACVAACTSMFQADAAAIEDMIACTQVDGKACDEILACAAEPQDDTDPAAPPTPTPAAPGGTGVALVFGFAPPPITAADCPAACDRLADCGGLDEMALDHDGCVATCTASFDASPNVARSVTGCVIEEGVACGEVILCGTLPAPPAFPNAVMPSTTKCAAACTAFANCGDSGTSSDDYKLCVGACVLGFEANGISFDMGPDGSQTLGCVLSVNQTCDGIWECVEHYANPAPACEGEACGMAFFADIEA